MPRATQKQDRRDQWGLKVGWVRFLLRWTLAGVALMLTSASFLLFAFLAPSAAYIALAGMALFLGAGILTALVAVLPLRWLQVPSTCPGCHQTDTVLRLPWRVAHICRFCGRRCWPERGAMLPRKWP